MQPGSSSSFRIVPVQMGLESFCELMAYGGRRSDLAQHYKRTAPLIVRWKT